MELYGQEMTKLLNIYEGWKNLVKENPELEPEFIERAKECASCKRNRLNFCKVCGCYIPAKVRSPQENCPLFFWKEIKQ